MEDQNSQQPVKQTDPVAPPPDLQPWAQPIPTAQAPVQATPAAAVTPPGKEPVNAGVVILQWLTYAFWGWTILALSALTATVIYSFLEDSGDNGFAPYGIAAVLVLLPISFICDFFYSKREPLKKTGIESAVMIIHAVIFALFGIGSLICTVIAVVMLLTQSVDSTGTQVFLASSFITSIYYALVLLRTLNLRILPWFSTTYRLIMVVTVGIIAILGIVGPVASERATRNDRLIESNLDSLANNIDEYADSKDKLPTSLNELTLSGDTKKLVENNLVTYKPEARTTGSKDKASRLNTYSSGRDIVYYYQLCVTYTKDTKSDYSSSNYSSSDDGYESYIRTYDHPKGETCYKLKTSEY